jgi:SnoaL-like domain
MTTLALLTEAEVKQFVAQWYHALDIHVPLADFLSMVADEGIEFRFPEVTVRDKAGLSEWYNRVTNSFFDEVHTTQELKISVEGDHATVELVTLWQPSIWNPPAAKSERLAYLAGQTWTVKRSEKTGKPVVVTYYVNTFDPVGETGALPVKNAAN